MYGDDSFHTLSIIGQIGLVLLSAALTAIVLWFAMVVMRWLPFPLRVVLAVLLFFGFVWLSPQVYYTYYMTFFEGLPWQVVIKGPPSMETLWKLLSFQGQATLSAHSQGLLGWALLAIAVFRRRKPSSASGDRVRQDAKSDAL